MTKQVAHGSGFEVRQHRTFRCRHIASEGLSGYYLKQHDSAVCGVSDEVDPI
jgi:hypothetical protein